MKKRIIALLSACTLLLGGCTPAGGDGSARELSVVLDWYPNALHTFLYANESFLAEGITIKPQPPAGVNDALSMVAAGKADFGIYYQQDMIQACADQDLAIKSIGTIVQAPLNIVLSLKEKNITSPKDLQGKTVGYAGNELSEALIRTLLEDGGIDPSDVSLIDVGFDLMASMVTGNVDATIGCLINHEVPQMEEQGLQVNYFYPSDYGVPLYDEFILVASDRIIAEEPEVVAAFLRACKNGFAQFKDRPYEMLNLLLENQDAENFPLTESVEQKSCDILLPLMEQEDAPFLSQNMEKWQKNIDWMHAQGLITSKPKVSDLVAEIEY